MVRDIISVAGQGPAPDPPRAGIGASGGIRAGVLLCGQPRCSREVRQGRFDYKAFLLPMAIAFAVTGMSRAPTLVTDIQSGYFDRLCMTPIRRTASASRADGGGRGRDHRTVHPGSRHRFRSRGPFRVRESRGFWRSSGSRRLWGLAFTGFPYAVALKTGSPAAVNATFVVFFPLFFLSDAVVPKQALTGWMASDRHVQPDHVPVECAPIPHNERLESRSSR